MKKIILILSLICSMNVYAASWPNTTPGNMTMSYFIGPGDRSTTFPRYAVLTDYVAGFNADSSTYDRIIFLCQSASNPSTGACPTSATGQSYLGETSINLQFTEKKSGISRNLIVKGYKHTRYDRWDCSEPQLTLNSQTRLCGSNVYGRGTTLSLYIPASEINKLPFGGEWEATLIFNVRRLAGSIYGKYTVNFNVKLTDKNNIQVWIPGFHRDPRIDLNLRPKGNMKYIGTNKMDMCFYDGYSSNSNSIEIKFHDDNITGKNTYHLKKLGDSTKVLPYNISLVLGGKTYNPVNGESLKINNTTDLEINWNRITAISMPEINEPVLCWPARLLLNADVYNPDAGEYSGNINITFTPSSENL